MFVLVSCRRRYVSGIMGHTGALSFVDDVNEALVFGSLHELIRFLRLQPSIMSEGQEPLEIHRISEPTRVIDEGRVI